MLKNLWPAGVVAAAITAVRIAYLIWWSPYELVADEAQYWDWSRHLDWSYHSKGPGVMALIAAATRAFGDAEWVVKLPAALSFAVVMLALAWLVSDATRDAAHSKRAAALVPVLVLLVPAYQLYGLMLSTDPPALACWSLALVAAWRTYRAEASGAPSLTAWLCLALAVGVGILCKYTDVLLVPGLMLFAWMTRADVSWRRAWRRALLAVVVLVVCVLPILVWNAQHGAASLRHLLSFVDAPGAERLRPEGGHWSWSTVLEYPLVQLAVIGPLLALALAAWSRRRQALAQAEQRLCTFLVCAAAPMLVVFLLASTRTRIEGNWPMAAFLSCVPLAVMAVARGLAPAWWRATIAYGTFALVVVHLPLVIAQLPQVGRFVPVHRFVGARASVAAWAPDVDAFLSRTPGRGIVIAPNHNVTGLLAYYLPSHPIVVSAGPLLDERPSSYDFIAATAIANPEWIGRPALFIGGTLDQWRAVCRCPDLKQVRAGAPLFETSSFVR